MNTGNVTDWTGNMLDIGPLYPFVGLEGLLAVIVLIFWIGWHVLQFRVENQRWREEIQLLKQNNNLDRALRGETIVRGK